MKKSFIPQSTAIREVVFDTNSHELTVWFHDNEVHTYHNVPEGVFEEFKSAKSAGSYFNSSIRDIY